MKNYSLLELALPLRDEVKIRLSQLGSCHCVSSSFHPNCPLSTGFNFPLSDRRPAPASQPSPGRRGQGLLLLSGLHRQVRPGGGHRQPRLSVGGDGRHQQVPGDGVDVRDQAVGDALSLALDAAGQPDRHEDRQLPLSRHR